jgi:hypothetical protein
MSHAEISNLASRQVLTQDVSGVQDVDNLGQSGATLRVRHGFARNYLIPQKKAVIATHATTSRFARSQEVRNGGTCSIPTSDQCILLNFDGQLC